MIMYMVASSEEAGIAYAAAQGWTAIARTRFVTPERHDVRLITRFRELVLMGDVVPMMKTPDYETGPADAGALDRWMKDKQEFDAFMATGRGEWIELMGSGDNA